MNTVSYHGNIIQKGFHVKNDVKMANYIIGVMEIIRWVASIAMHQQLNLAEIKKKYKSRRVKPEGRKQPHQLNSVVYPLNCTLYMGTDSIILNNLPLAYVMEVLHPAKFEIMRKLCPKMNEEELKEEFDQRYHSEKILVITDDVDKAGNLLCEENPKKGVLERKRKEEGIILSYLKQGMSSNVSCVLPNVESTESTDMDYDGK